MVCRAARRLLAPRGNGNLMLAWRAFSLFAGAFLMLVTLPTPGGAEMVALDSGRGGGLGSESTVPVAQTIAFVALPGKFANDSPFGLSAIASSGLPVNFTVTGPATLSGNTLTLAGVAGTVRITAHQAGSAGFLAAPDVVRAFSVSLAAQTITFAALPTKLATDVPFALTATASSGLPVSFTVVGPAALNAATNFLTLTGVPGTVTVTATQVGNGTFSFATAVARTFPVVAPITVAQNIVFASLGNKLANSAPFALSAFSTSGLVVNFTVTGPATLSGNWLTLTGAVGTVTVTARQAGNALYLVAPEVVRTFMVSPAPSSRLINISSRARVTANGTQRLITGFVISGTEPKPILLRAIGPALVPFGISTALVNPRLKLYDSKSNLLLENDDWSGADTATSFGQLGAFSLGAGSRDAAMLATLAPGAYTMSVDSATEDGVALAEVYDASGTSATDPARIVNVSTRGTVEAGAGVLVGGFVVTGNAPKKMLVRGVGPTLVSYGVAGVLAHPRLAIFSGSTVVAQNDDWAVPTPVEGQAAATGVELAAAAQASLAFALPAGSKDSAVLVTLAPGIYTAQISGADNPTGVALLEIYEVP